MKVLAVVHHQALYKFVFLFRYDYFVISIYFKLFIYLFE